MDIRTGKTYATEAEAAADGVPPSDLAEVQRGPTAAPIVRFKSGPFKDRTYMRTATGQLVRVDR